MTFTANTKTCCGTWQQSTPPEGIYLVGKHRPASALTDVKNNQGKQSLCAIKFSTHTGSKTGPPTHLRDPHPTFGHNRTRRPRRPQRRQGRGCRGSRGRGWSPRPCPAAGARRLPGGKKKKSVRGAVGQRVSGVCLAGTCAFSSTKLVVLPTLTLLASKINTCRRVCGSSIQTLK